MTSLKKKPETQSQVFFIADMKTCWIFWGIEQLSSAIVDGDIAHANCRILALAYQKPTC